jgi:hypothetical protein
MAKNKVYTPKGYKKMPCSKCETVVDRVNNDTASVICWKCTMQSLKKYETVIRETDTR